MTNQTAASEAVWARLELHQNSGCDCVTVDECYAAQIAILDSFARVEVLRGQVYEHELCCEDVACGGLGGCPRYKLLQAQLKEAEEGR